MISETKTIGAPTLRRELKTRHLTMIATGSSIDMGLSVTSGATTSQAGPGGALLSYTLIGLMVCFLMASLDELAVFMPMSGFFTIYSQNYAEESFGSVLGWNYWHSWAVMIAVDLMASQLAVNYWFSDIPGWIWSASSLGIMLLLNWISVRDFDEAKYWFSLIEAAAVIISIIAGVMMIVGIFEGSQPTGWGNWGIADASFADDFSAMIGTAMIVGFSFQGTELIGVTVGESEDPEKNIPRAMRQVLWRILLFHVLAILIISLIIPYIDPSLLRNDVKDISISPFTLVFQHAGLLSAVTIMSAVVLIAVLSAGNSGMYASTHMLYTLACDSRASRIFSKLSRDGVPHNALYATAVTAALCFLTPMFGNQMMYLWLLNTSGMTGLIAQLGIVISHYRFRRGYVMQDNDINSLPYRSGFFPLGPTFAFILCLIITLGQNYGASLKGTIDRGGMAATYIGIPLSLVIWSDYKLTKGTRFIRCSEMTFPDRFKC